MIFSVLCLVPFLLACFSDQGQIEIITPNILESGYAQPAPFYDVVLPESINTYIIWDQRSPLIVKSMTQKTSVLNNDTILVGFDPFFEVEMLRLEMEIAIAEAVGDSALVDSLSNELDHPSLFTYVLSPSEGMIQLMTDIDNTLQPGDSIGLIVGSPPDSLYFLSPDYNHIRWPEDLAENIVTSEGLQFNGYPPEEPASLPGVWSIEHRFIHETELDSYLITITSDTIPIIVMGTKENAKIIYSVLALDSISVIPW